MPKQRDRARIRDEKAARWMQTRIQARKSRKHTAGLAATLEAYLDARHNLEIAAQQTPEDRETAERVLRDLEAVLIDAGITREQLTELVEGHSIDLPEP